MANSEVSKGTADRIAYSKGIESAIEVQGEAVARSATEAFAGELPAGFSFAMLTAMLLGWIRRAGDELREADLVHVAELTDDAGPRAERDAAFAALREAVMRAADLVRGAYGELFADKVGLGAAVGTRMDLVASQARNAIHLLRTTAAPARFLGTRVELGDVARVLEERTVAMERALGAVSARSARRSRRCRGATRRPSAGSASPTAWRPCSSASARSAATTISPPVSVLLAAAL